MITAITFTSQVNTKYIAVASVPRIYGEDTITDLQMELAGMLDRITKIDSVVKTFNQDLNFFTGEGVVKILTDTFRHAPQITIKTKTSRTYYIAGLTIHFKD